MTELTAGAGGRPPAPARRAPGAGHGRARPRGGPRPGRHIAAGYAGGPIVPAAIAAGLGRLTPGEMARVLPAGQAAAPGGTPMERPPWPAPVRSRGRRASDRAVAGRGPVLGECPHEEIDEPALGRGARALWQRVQGDVDRFQA